MRARAASRRRAPGGRSGGRSGGVVLGCWLVVAALGLTGCAAPGYRFETNAANEVVLKMPRSWALVRAGVPARSDGTAAAAGSWLAIYDAAARPSVDHAASNHAVAPVAVIHTFALTKDTGASVSDDQLRDLEWPVSVGARAEAALSGFTGRGFALITDQRIDTRAAHGVHVVYTYDLGEGPEVFDQIAVTDASKTRVHLFAVHCTKACYDANRPDILATVGSFTVKSP